MESVAKPLNDHLAHLPGALGEMAALFALIFHAEDQEGIGIAELCGVLDARPQAGAAEAGLQARPRRLLALSLFLVAFLREPASLVALAPAPTLVAAAEGCVVVAEREGVPLLG